MRQTRTLYTQDNLKTKIICGCLEISKIFNRLLPFTSNDIHLPDVPRVKDRSKAVTQNLYESWRVSTNDVSQPIGIPPNVKLRNWY